MKKRKISVSIVSILVVFGAILIAISVKSNQQLNNEKDIKKTVIGALKIYEMFIYPAEYTKSPDIQIPQEVIDKKLKEVTQACEKYFSSKSGWLANRLNVYQQAVLAEAHPPTDMRTVENKITDVKFLEIKIDGDTATVVADVYAEGKSIGLALDTDKIPASELNEITNAKGYKMSPEEQKKFIEKTEKLPKKIREYKVKSITRHYFNLAKENGEWKITSETFDFLPGYEP